MEGKISSILSLTTRVGANHSHSMTVLLPCIILLMFVQDMSMELMGRVLAMFVGESFMEDLPEQLTMLPEEMEMEMEMLKVGTWVVTTVQLLLSIVQDKEEHWTLILPSP